MVLFRVWEGRGDEGCWEEKEERLCYELGEARSLCGGRLTAENSIFWTWAMMVRRRLREEGTEMGSPGTEGSMIKKIQNGGQTSHRAVAWYKIFLMEPNMSRSGKERDDWPG